MFAAKAAAHRGDESGFVLIRDFPPRWLPRSSLISSGPTHVAAIVLISPAEEFVISESFRPGLVPGHVVSTSDPISEPMTEFHSWESRIGRSAAGAAAATATMSSSGA